MFARRATVAGAFPRTLIFLPLAAATVVGAALIPFRPHGASGAVTWTIVDLGLPWNAYNSRADDINNAGQVLAYSDGDGTHGHAFIWQNGSVTDLYPQLPKDNNGKGAEATAINDNGDVISGSSNAPVLDRGGKLTSLGPLVLASSLNDGDVVAGGQGVQCCLNAAIWQNGSTQTFGPPGLISSSDDINLAGHVVGQMQFTQNGSDHPFFWNGGTPMDLGTFGGCSGTAKGINDSDQVVGYADPKGYCGAFMHAFLWQGGSMQDLGVCPHATVSEAFDINTSGQIVGQCGYPFQPSHAVLWEPGATYDLNVLIDGDLGWTLITASAINDQGMIVGTGLLNGAYHAYVLYPPNVPAPTATSTATATPQDTPTPGATPTPTPSTTPAPTDDRAVAYQIDGAHDGNLPDDPLHPPLALRWSRDLGGNVSYPIIVGGRLFVTINEDSSTNAVVKALDPSTGRLLWKRVVGSGGPMNMHWSGLAYDAGRLFEVDQSGLAQALDPATGKQIWQHQITTTWVFTSPPTAYNGRVFITGSGTGGEVYALSETDGHELWSASTDGGDHSSPALSTTRAYVSFTCVQVYGFDQSSGVQSWHYNSGCSGGGGTTPVYALGKVWVRGSCPGFAFDGVSGAASTYDVGCEDPAPAFSGNIRVIQHVDGPVVAEDVASGQQLWSFTGDGLLDAAPIIVNGEVYVGSSGGELHAINLATGHIDWNTNVGHGIMKPDERNWGPVTTGLGAGEGFLAVPSGPVLNVYSNR